jgi:hypothetical protein
LVESPHQTIRRFSVARARLSGVGGTIFVVREISVPVRSWVALIFGLGELVWGVPESHGWGLVSLWGDRMHSALDFALLLVALGLVWVDAIVTKMGLGLGFGERNPVLRSFIKTFGLTGLMATRTLASVLLLFLFVVLNQLEWLLLAIPFTLIMGCVVLMNLKRTG